MENYNNEMAARVWQRVHSDAPQTGLQTLTAEELSIGAVFQALAKQMQVREKALLYRLFEQEQEHAACLKGIHYFAAGEPLRVKAAPPAADSMPIALRKCYSRKLKMIAEYEKRSDDPEYGHIFHTLAQQEREHCRILLQLAGGLK